MDKNICQPDGCDRSASDWYYREDKEYSYGEANQQKRSDSLWNIEGNGAWSGFAPLKTESDRIYKGISRSYELCWRWTAWSYSQFAKGLIDVKIKSKVRWDALTAYVASAFMSFWSQLNSDYHSVCAVSVIYWEGGLTTNDIDRQIGFVILKRLLHE